MNARRRARGDAPATKDNQVHDPNSHGKTITQISADFETHLEYGLAQAEAGRRLAAQGANELSERPRPGFLALLWDQFNNYLVIILVIAAVVSLLLGEWVDSVAIMVIVVLNAIVGVVQESKAEQALAALKKMAAPSAQVIRDGRQVTVRGSEIVVGDIVLLEAGNYVPADVRLFESFNLKVEEASLTGESVPVDKNPAVVLDHDIPLGDRRNTAFMGTLVTYGRGKGLVTCTGMNTQIGLIAQMIQSFEDEEHPAPEETRASRQGPRDSLPRDLRDRFHLRPLPRHEHQRRARYRLHRLSPGRDARTSSISS